MGLIVVLEKNEEHNLFCLDLMFISSSYVSSLWDSLQEITQVYIPALLYGVVDIKSFHSKGLVHMNSIISEAAFSSILWQSTLNRQNKLLLSKCLTRAYKEVFRLICIKTEKYI